MPSQTKCNNRSLNINLTYYYVRHACDAEIHQTQQQHAAADEVVLSHAAQQIHVYRHSSPLMFAAAAAGISVDIDCICCSSQCHAPANLLECNGHGICTFLSLSKYITVIVTPWTKLSLFYTILSTFVVVVFLSVWVARVNYPCSADSSLLKIVNWHGMVWHDMAWHRMALPHTTVLGQ